MAIDKNLSLGGIVSSGFRCGVDADRFDELVTALKVALGPCSGLTSDDVDVSYLSRLMEEYKANDKGWERYAMGDPSRGYTRNLVDEGNGKSNLVGSRPHPHPRESPKRLQHISNGEIACPRMEPGERKSHP